MFNFPPQSFPGLKQMGEIEGVEEDDEERE